MIRRLEDHLPLVFVIVIPLAYILFFVLSLPTNAQTSTVYDVVFRFVLFVPFALAVTVIFIGQVLLCRRSEDGTVALWLAAATYGYGCLVLMWWGIVGLFAVNTFRLTLTPEAQGMFLRAIANAMIGGGLVGEVIAATVMVVGFRTRTLGHHIDPWPWSRRQRAHKRRRENNANESYSRTIEDDIWGRERQGERLGERPKDEEGE